MYLIITTAKILIGFTFCGNYIITVICIDNVKASFHNNLHWFSSPIAIQHLAVNAQVYNVVRWLVFNRMDKQVSMYVCLARCFITSSSIFHHWSVRWEEIYQQTFYCPTGIQIQSCNSQIMFG